MSATGGPDPDPDDRAAEALDRYLDAARSDGRPDRAAFLAAHPDLADRLGPLLPTVEAACRGGRELAAELGTAPPPLPAGTRLGRYAVVRLVGRGGMGEVYEAAEDGTGRRVAVKVLPAGAAADRRLRDRFLHEAATAALLRHPNIVPAEVGASDGGDGPTGRDLFYVMPFIDGRPLDAVLRAVRTAAGGGPPADAGAAALAARLLAGFPPDDRPDPPAGSPSDPRYVRAVADLAAQAASALAHAHAQGVVHRDVKPGNLLLEVSGKVWLTDFGLALGRDARADRTSSGGRVGTTRYMAPEQAAGRREAVDGRADVYALGATLYELLALRPAFEAATEAELVGRVLGSDPPPLRAFNPGVPPALAAVVAVAMQKEPADRYPSAQAMADDLRRFLAGEPVLGRPPGRLKRFRRWAGRHRRALAAPAGAAVVGAALGLGASGHAVLTAYRAERAAREAAERRGRQLLDLVDELLRADESLKNTPGAGAARAGHARRAAAVVSGWADEPGAGPDVRAAAARVWLRVYEAEHFRGDRAAALDALSECVRRQEAAVRADPGSPDARFQLAEWLWLSATLRGDSGDAAGGLADTRAAVALYEGLAAADPDRAKYRNRLSGLYHTLALDRARRGDFAGADELARRGLAADEGLARQYPTGHPASYLRLSGSWQTMAEVRSRAGDWDGAVAALRAAAEHERTVDRLFPADWDARAAAYAGRLSLASQLLGRGEPAAAGPALAEARAAAELAAEKFPDRPAYQVALAGCDRAAGLLAYLGGREAEARDLYARMAGRHRRLPASFAGWCVEQQARVPVPGVVEPADLARRLAAVPAAEFDPEVYAVTAALVRLRAGDLSAAEAGLRAAIAHAPPHRRDADGTARYYLAVCLAGQGRGDAARRAYAEAEAADLLRFAPLEFVRVAREEARRAIDGGGR